MSPLYRNLSNGVKIAFVLIVLLFFMSGDKQVDRLEDSGEAIQLASSVSKVRIESGMSIFVDQSGELDIQDVSQPILGMQFMPNIDGTLNAGYTEQVYWIRFDVVNNAGDESWLLEAATSTLDKATLYTQSDNGTFEVVQSGSMIPVRDRGFYHHHLVFPLAFNGDPRKTFYLRAETDGPMQLPLAIWEETAFEAQTRTTAALIGLTAGILLILVCFHFFQFIKVRQLSHLYFTFLALSLFAAMLSLAGLTLAFIWPEWGWWDERTMLFFIGSSSIFLLLFTENFLDTRRHLPRIEKVFQSLIGLDLALMTLLLLSQRVAVHLIPLLLVTACLLVFVLSVLCLKREIRYARYYTIGSFLLLFAVLLSYLSLNGFIPFTIRARHGAYIAAGLGLFLTALAIMDKAAVKKQDMLELERKATERQKMKMESLKHANERKDEMLAITSHNLRTPLYGMIGIAESLQETVSGRNAQGVSQQLGTIVANGKKLAHMINDILDFSKLKQNLLDVHVEPIMLRELAESVFAVCRPLLKDKEVSLYLKMPEDLPEAIADPERVQQVLFNLIDNSIKFTEAGEIIVSAKKSGKQIRISVQDTGIGIDQSELPTLFEPLHFENGNEGARKGGGIGLNLTKRLVELQGGWLEVESTPGEGSTFSFTLPIYKKEEMEEDEASGTVEIEELTAAQLTQSLSQRRRDQKEIRVLVVDPIDVNREMLTFQLMRDGYEAAGVSTGAQAIQLLSEQPIDLVILEWALSDMTGDELCQSIRRDFTLTELPILMLSEEEDLKHKTSAFTAGANDYLVKPCDKEEFLLRVETLANLRSLTQEITNVNYFLERNIKERTMALEITNMNLVTVNDEIQEIEKSRNEMLSTISHELGTPITLIHSYIQAVKESLIDEKNPRYLDMIHNKLLLLERLTEDLVELSKYKSGNMTLRFEEVRLTQWLNRLIFGMEADVTQSGRIFEHLKGRNDPFEEQFMLSIDIDRIDQVFSNVLWNAVKHTSSEDGKITISADVYASGTEGAILDLDEFDGEVIIKVADTGCGIDQEVLPHIFDRFFKMEKSEQYKGSGLGLAIAKEIILSHKGEIWAESEVGKGSAFYIALPLRF